MRERNIPRTHGLLSTFDQIKTHRPTESSLNCVRLGSRMLLVFLLWSVAAAQAMLVPGDTTPMDPAVDKNTGAARFSIPIQVPPGPGGLAPDLSLRYSSHRSDGPYGVGWGLDLGEIGCSQRFGVPDYAFAACEKFELNGQLLTRDGASNFYHSFVETFQKIEYLAGPKIWEVTDPNGTIARFGVNGDARVLSGEEIARWLLSEIHDPFGNTIFITYDDTTDTGTRYPAKITYGANATKQSGDRTIEFIFDEDRPDPIHDYAGGIEREITKRLTDIKVLSHGLLARRYAFGYDGADENGNLIDYTTDRSRLAWVQQFGNDCPGDISLCTGLPRREYVYTDSKDDGLIGQHSKFIKEDSYPPIYYGTFENAFPHPENYSIDFAGSVFQRGYGVRTADVNGDGLVDLIEGGFMGGALRELNGIAAQDLNTLKVRLNTGQGFIKDPAWTAAFRELEVERPRADFEQTIHNVLASPVSDVLYLGESGIIDESPNSVLYSSVEHPIGIAPQPDMTRPDVRYSTNSYEDLLAYGRSSGWIEAMGRLFFADINADGLADIIVSVRLSGVDRVLDANGVTIAPTSVQRQPGLTVRNVYRNSGDPAIGWIRDDTLAAGLPPFGVVQYESDHGAESRIPFGQSPDPANLYSAQGDLSSGYEIIEHNGRDACTPRGLLGGSDDGYIPITLQPDVCIGLVDLAPRFVDFNGDGFLDVMVLDLEDPTALHQGTLYGGRGTGAKSVPRNRARSQAWIQRPNAAAGSPRWVRASQFDLPNVPFLSIANGGNLPGVDDEWILFSHSQPLLNSAMAPPPGCPGNGLFGSQSWEVCAPLSFNTDTGMRFVDLNRDGLTDVIWSLSQYYVPLSGNGGYAGYPTVAEGVMLNTGSGWCTSVLEMADHVESYCPHASIYYPPESNWGEVTHTAADPAGPNGFGFEIYGHTGPASGYLADLNADGFLDYIQAHNTLYVGKKAWLFDPAGASLTPPNVWIRDDRYDVDLDFMHLTYGGSRDPNYLGLAVLDVNGDGAADVVGDDLKEVLVGGAQGNIFPQVFLSKSKHSDLIRLVRNGTGGEVQITYESAIIARDSALTNPPGSLDLEIAAEQHAVATAEGLDGTNIADAVRWLPRPVVSEVRVSGPNRKPDPADPSSDFGSPARYRYAHPRYCVKSRSDLGFRVVEQTRPGGEVVLSKYYQTHGRAGKISQVTVSEDGVAVHFRQEYWETQEQSAQLPQPDVRPLVPALQAGSIDDPDVHVGRLARILSHNSYQSQSGAVSMRTFHYEDDYDYGYNFVEKILDKRPTGLLVTLREPASDYSNSIFGLISRQKLFDHVQNNIDSDLFLKDTSYSYTNGRASNTTERVKPRDGAGSGVDESHSRDYDVYGNLTRESVHGPGGDQVTDFCFDGDDAVGDDAAWCPGFGQDSHSIRVGIRDAAGGIVSFEPDPAMSVIVETNSTYLDEPGIRIELDVFGRPIESHVHDGSSWLRTSTIAYDDLPFSPSVVTQWVYPEAGSGNGDSIWSSRVSDGFGGIWKEIDETPLGFVGTFKYHDPLLRKQQTSLPIDCGGDSSCQAFDGSSQPIATLSEVDAIGRPVYSESPDGFSLFKYSAIASSSLAAPWTASLNRFDVVLEKNGKGDLTLRGSDRDRIVWVEECENTVLPGTSDLSSMTCSGDSGGSAPSTFYAYEATGEVRAIFDPRAGPSFDDPNHVFEYHYDTLGRVVQIDDPALAGSGHTQTSYSAYGNVRDSINARGQIRTHTYDVLNRLTGVTTPTGETDYVISYRPNERKPSGDSSADYQRTIRFDSLGRVEKEALAIRNASNRLQSFHTDFTYDLLGRTTEIHYPAKHFGIFGWLDSVVRFEYDGKFLEQVCELGWGSRCDSADVNFVSSADFDALGRLSSLTLPTGTRSFEYTTDTHRLAKDEFISSAYQYTRNYLTYDEVGNLTSVMGSESASEALNMNEVYRYDARNRIEQWTKGGTQYDYGYDDLGNLTKHAGRIQRYDDTDRPQAITQRDLASTSPDLQDYTYDDDGNVKSIVGSGVSRFFSFDSANQINCLGEGSSPCTTRIAYDVRGKRIAEYPSSGKTFTAYVGDSFRYQHDLIVAHATIEIMLDGRRVALKRFRPQLRAATIGLVPVRIDPRWTTGGLAGLGAILLILAIRNGGFALIQLRPLRGTTAIAAVALLLMPSVASGAVPTNASLPNYYWEISDALGTGMVMISESGERVRHQVFTPFGEVHDEVGSNFPTFYAGHRRHESSGMFYMQARWYDPGAGRFLSIDPLIRTQMNPQSANAYSYTENNPTNGIDPTGTHVLGWTGSSGRLAGNSGFDDSSDKDSAQLNTYVSAVAAQSSAGRSEQREGESGGGLRLGGGEAAPAGHSGSAASRIETNGAISGSSASQSGAAGGGIWSGIWSIAKSVASILASDVIGAVFGFAFGNALGIIAGIGTVLGGVLSGNLSMITSGIGMFGNALVPRFGFNSGPGHGYPSLMPRTVIDLATRIHDKAYARLSRSGVGMFSPKSAAADVQLIRNVWSSHRLGPVGQAYRLGLTAAFGIKIGAQTGFGAAGALN
ncbi:MAG TPA: hypothetical protein EYG08_11340 [Myxococcales bacterium]|nr:hypothetical protein [Myxococcales bacterium]